MGVYIKGMEMPRTCYDCKLRRRNGLELICPVLERSYKIADTQILFVREKDCPLIEVPEPHGRLGDLDALPWYLANTSVKYATYEDWEMLCDAIAAAPTVIPASEEGEA